MSEAKVNYGGIHFVGSALLGMLFALLPTALFLKVTGSRVGAVLFFLPTAIFLTRALLWTQERVIKGDAESVRRRYEAGRIPVGKDCK